MQVYYKLIQLLNYKINLKLKTFLPVYFVNNHFTYCIIKQLEWPTPSEMSCLTEGDLERLVSEGCLLVSELMKEMASSPSAVPIRDAL